MSWERSGVPGGYTGTDWHRHDVATMWQALDGQHTDNHWKLVSGWRRTAELTATHLSRLEHYRANLIAAWPPDRNAAAAAYVSRLDFLIQNVRATHEVAVANYTTFGATVGALAGAQRELKPLYDEYLRTRQAIRDHESMMAHNSASEAVSTVWQPPATQRDLEVLNNRARAIMFSLSHTLIEAEAAIKHPPTYTPQSSMEQIDPDIYGTGNAGPATRAHRSTRVINDGKPSSRTPPVAASDLERAASRPDPPRKPIATAGWSGRTISTTPPPWAHSPDSKGAPPSHRKVTETTIRQRRPLPPGGVIGTMPVATDTPHLVRQPNRINPIGGVITGMQPPGFFATRHPSNSVGDAVRRHRRTADDPWTAERGVPAILKPPMDPGPIDPGPAIGLSR